jgi:REP element-mobilizing transposase RayT
MGYVVMPEHFHLLMSEPQEGDPSKAMQLVKQLYAQRVVPVMPRGNEGLPSARVPQHVWQARFMISTFGLNTSASRSCVTCIAIQ